MTLKEAHTVALLLRRVRGRADAITKAVAMLAGTVSESSITMEPIRDLAEGMKSLAAAVELIVIASSVAPPSATGIQ